MVRKEEVGEGEGEEEEGEVEEEGPKIGAAREAAGEGGKRGVWGEEGMEGGRLCRREPCTSRGETWQAV